ncbi:MAG TPA: DUF58 domain-containing protein [Bacteroidia bacterium]|nr:DUF58 domain-containing protein [Bacteroidia bacterium]
MTEAEIIEKVRRVEIKARGLSNQVFMGEYHSAFKGRGMTFSEVREYQPGDDIRTIDWNVTARFNNPYVKIFHEERELSVMILVDISKSGQFGTHVQDKKDLMTEIAAVLAFSAIFNNDNAGILFFSDKVEKFIPPKKGRTHILRIIRECIVTEPKGKGTNIQAALEYFNNTLRNRCIMFLVSDFMAGTFEQGLRISARRHDVVALNIFDHREQDLPSIGLVQMADMETGELIWVDTSDEQVRSKFNRTAIMHRFYLDDLFGKFGIDHAHVATGDNYVRKLSKIFRQREKKR